MNDLQLPFIVFNCFLLVFYLIRRNGFDLFGISYFSSVIYFSPGFFGFSGVLVNLKDWIYSPIHEKTYIVYFIFQLIVLIVTIIHDFLVNFRSKFNFTNPSGNDIYKFEVYSCLILLIVSFSLVNILGGGALHQLDKDQVMANVGRWYVLYESLMTLAFAYIFTIAKFKKRYLICLLFLVFDIYLGFRTSFVITLLMLFFVFFNMRGKRLIAHWPYLLLASVTVFSVLLLKLLMFGLKKGDLDLLMTVLSNKDTYEKLLSTSEPFVTQEILNAVVTLDFKTDGEHLKLIPLQFVLLGDVVFGSIGSFNDYFQHKLYPKITYGMASNFLAEFYAVAGYLGVVFISFVYASLLFFMNLGMQLVRDKYKPILLLLGVYWAFYIYRNDVAYLLNIEKRILISFVFIAFVSFVIKKMVAHKDFR